jgi:ATP-dependent DNA helicase RecG
MVINQNKVRALVSSGEGISAEFKECKDEIPKSVYKTVCSFLNRHGGTILLGVDDSGKIIGISEQNVGKLKSDFVTTINNYQKISPPAYLSVDIVQIEDKWIIGIFVPESSNVHRCNGRIYDRNEDSDIDITDNTKLVYDMYTRKQASYSENKIFPFADIGDLRKDLIQKTRKMASAWRQTTPGSP